MTDNKVVAAYPRLMLAYFLQFAVWGSYGFALTGFAINVLKFSGIQIGWIGAAVPIGALIAPLVGRVADRYMSAQYVLSILQFLCAGLLIYAGTQTEFQNMMIALVLVGIFYMPTIPLINSIVFEHVPNPDNAPRVFMFGTIGWIAIVLFIQAFFGAGDTNEFFYIGAGCSLLLAIYALTLPNTPPKAADSAPGEKAPSAWGLLAEPKFAVFAFTILIAGLAACGFFFTTCFPMLGQRAYPGGIALTTLNQISEVLFMALLPILAVRFGLKNVLLIGIAAWFARYVCFMSAAFELALLGLLLHGLCYSCLYAGSYMYGDKIASKEMKASVQSLIGFILLGVGQIGGSILAGQLLDIFPPVVKNYAVTEDGKIAINSDLESAKPLPNWSNPDMAESAWNALDLKQYVTSPENANKVNPIWNALKLPVKQKDKAPEGIDLNSLVKDGKITLDSIKDLEVGEQKFSAAQLTDMFTTVLEKMGNKPADGKLEITRAQYMQAQTNNWPMIMAVPSGMMALAFLFFLVLGKNPEKNEE